VRRRKFRRICNFHNILGDAIFQKSETLFVERGPEQSCNNRCSEKDDSGPKGPEGPREPNGSGNSNCEITVPSLHACFFARSGMVRSRASQTETIAAVPASSAPPGNPLTVQRVLPLLQAPD